MCCSPGDGVVEDASTSTYTPTTALILQEDIQQQQLNTSEGCFPANLSNINDVLSSGQPFYCTYHEQRRNLDCEIWMKDGKYHGTAIYKTYDVHVVCDGTWVFIWTENMGTGIKYKISEIRGLTGKVDRPLLEAKRVVALDTDAVDLTSAVDVDCRPAVVGDELLAADPNVDYRTRTAIYDAVYDSGLSRQVSCEDYVVFPFGECTVC